MITNVSGPDDLGCGGSEWKVWFDLPKAAGADGWVIQEITVTYDIKNDDGSQFKKQTYHYWEAWKVEKGKTGTVWQDKGLDDNDDNYSDSSYPGKKGTITTVGKAKFYEGPLPPDFKKNNPDTIAGILHSSIKKPPFWDGTGTDHNATTTFDCTGGKNTSKVTGKAGDKTLESK